jgi:hypothetical protein
MTEWFFCTAFFRHGQREDSNARRAFRLDRVVAVDHVPGTDRLRVFLAHEGSFLITGTDAARLDLVLRRQPGYEGLLPGPAADQTHSDMHRR